MITGFSAISLVLGTTIAYLANSYPPHRAVMETVGGILLLGRLGLMGYALEEVQGPPSGRHTCNNDHDRPRPPSTQACAITTSSSPNDDPGRPSRRERACSRSHSALFSKGAVTKWVAALIAGIAAPLTNGTFVPQSELVLSPGAHGQT